MADGLARAYIYVIRAKRVNVDGFGKPRIDQNSRRGEGGVGFLVRECIAEDVEFIRDVRYKESVYEVGEGKKLCTYVVCICQLRVVRLL